KAIARRSARTAFTHRVDIRSHQVTADEPTEHGGDDEGPSPQELLAASLASCTAITMEMYSKRKGWDIGPVEVECEHTPAERARPRVGPTPRSPRLPRGARRAPAPHRPAPRRSPESLPYAGRRRTRPRARRGQWPLRNSRAPARRHARGRCRDHAGVAPARCA